MEYLILHGSTTDGMVSLPNLKGEMLTLCLEDYVKEFDYYSPVIIANNDYLKDNKKKHVKSSKLSKKDTNMLWSIQRKQLISSSKMHLN